MTDGEIVVPPDSTGKRIDTEEVSFSGTPRQRERMQIAGAGPTDIALVNAADGLDVDVTRLPVGSNLIGKVKIRNPGDTVDLGDATNPMPVVAPKSSTATAAVQTAVGTTAVQILAANTSRKRVMVQNTGTTIIKISLSSTDPTQTVYHLAIAPGSIADDGKGGVYIDEMWQGVVKAISSGAGGTVSVVELT